MIYSASADQVGSGSLLVQTGAHNEKEHTTLNTARELTFRQQST